MSALAAIVDRFKGQYQTGVGMVRSRLFGVNNERLDLMMDSFNKLAPGQRTAVVAGIIGLISVFVMGAVILYFSQVGALKDDLNNSFAAMHELRTLKSTYTNESQKFEKVVSGVQRKTGAVKAKPFFEKIAKEMDVKIEGLSEKKVPLAPENPLSGKMSEIHVDMRFPKISIPRLLNFIMEVEKKGSYFRVNDLKIRGRYGTRLYFDGEAKFRGYEVGS